jgi:putative ABC transport system permease protein
MVMVDFMKRSIDDGFAIFGDDTVVVSTVQLMGDDSGDDLWMKRPTITQQEYRFVSDNADSIGLSAYYSTIRSVVEANGKEIDNCDIIGVDGDWNLILGASVEEGRELNIKDIVTSSSVVLIGSDIARDLFIEKKSIVGERIDISNHSYTIIGVMQRVGERSLSIFDIDNSIVVPVKALSNIFEIDRCANTIAARPQDGTSVDELIYQIRLLIRSNRGLNPTQKDNFGIDRMDDIAEEMSTVLSGVNKIGAIIALFSLLIGAFSITNILYVSVSERVTQIGIKMALGSKRFAILVDFLKESALLSLLGSTLGVVLAYISILVINATADITLRLSMIHIFKVMAIALIIGVLAGVVPAYTASRLNPIDAINDI